MSGRSPSSTCWRRITSRRMATSAVPTGCASRSSRTAGRSASQPPTAARPRAWRSPMAEGILKMLHGRRIFVDSAGVRGGEVDGFAVAVMDEIGLDLTRHRAKTFDELEDTSFDLIVSLSPEAQHRAVELTRTMAAEIEFWNTMDPSIV